MTDRRMAERPVAREQMPGRNRRRWAITAGILAGWVLLLVVTGSLLAGTALLLLLVALGIGCVAGLRALGVDARHPWAGAGRAGDHPDQVAAGEGRYGGGGAAWSEPAAAWPEPAGDLGYGHDNSRYGDDGYLSARDGYAGARDGYAGARDGYAGSRPGYAGGHDGFTHGEAALVATVAVGAPTVAQPHRPPIPLLRLVTGDSVTETRTSGARAGRGAVDLVLPEVPTVSREHARFTYTDGQWWVVNLGRNGLMLNGVPLTGAHPLRDGDSIQWGQASDALLSQVEIG